jgi:hypothetical protein
MTAAHNANRARGIRRFTRNDLDVFGGKYVRVVTSDSSRERKLSRQAPDISYGFVKVGS